MRAHPSPGSLPRFARWLVVAVVCVSLGLQWAVLQGIAWTGMLISYSRDASLIEAVTKTFDGEHPCPLCKVVESSQKQAQEKNLTQPPAKKFEAVLVTLAWVVPPHGIAMDYRPISQVGELRASLRRGRRREQSQPDSGNDARAVKRRRPAAALASQ